MNFSNNLLNRNKIVSAKSNLLNKDVQNMLNWFVFFLVFPAINILGNSITFYFFIYIIFQLGTFWTKTFYGKKIFFVFFFIALLSTLLSSFIEMPRHPGFTANIQILVQYLYWILVASFFSIYYTRINIIELSKWVFYGIIATSIGFYFLPFNLDFGIGLIEISQTRNAFVFTLLCTMPLSIFYIKKRFKGMQIAAVLIIMLLNILFSNGRSGAILGILEIMLMSAIIYPNLNKIIRVFSIPFVGLILFMQTDSSQIYLDIAANNLESINPRFADMLRNDESSSLESDKSWLHRKLMIDKGLEIYSDYPILGIGPNNFSFYDAEMKTYQAYGRLTNHPKEFYNHRSAHNSYIQIISETGTLGIIALIIILLIPISYFIYYLIMNKQSLDLLPLLSILGISIHFYAISTLTGAIPWFVIGIAWGATNKIKKNI